MNKSKVILGIAMMLLGGSIMLENMISGIFRFTGKYHEDFQTYRLEPQAPQAPLERSFVSVKEGRLLSVWLKYSNRQMENKNINIAVFLIDEDENIVSKFEKDLLFDRFRSGAKKVRYIKLGEYYAGKEFRGYLHYELDGTWLPEKTSALVIRKSAPGILPLKQIGFFVAGIFALLVGIDTIAKNYKNRRHIMNH